MDSTGDPEDELRDLTRQLRAGLQRHAALGAWAAPGGPTAAYAGGAEAGEGAEVAAGAGVGEAVDIAAHAEQAPAVDVAAQAAPAPVASAMAAAPADRAAPLLLDVEPEQLIPLGRRSLAQIREELGDCQRCKLHTTRQNIVFGVGAEDAPLMFVGEAPGEQEDRRGEPFVGPAGELLDKMIEAMGWTRQTVYIANTTKCRPPGNRNPQADELAQCTPFLDAQIRAIAPRIIVTLGRPAANHVLGRDAPISALRGRFHDRAGAGAADVHRRGPGGRRGPPGRAVRRARGPTPRRVVGRAGPAP